ncbi:MAG: hypothetical protein FWF33_00605 [Clostridiales bacterium]|nr:hypothetical protein [Clostridiales bacterium]
MKKGKREVSQQHSRHGKTLKVAEFEYQQQHKGKDWRESPRTFDELTHSMAGSGRDKKRIAANARRQREKAR